MSEEEINKTLDEIFKEDTQTIRERMKSLIKSYDNALGNLVKKDKEIQELKRCIDAQKILRKDMPKDTKLILMYSEDYKRIFKEE